MSQYVPSNHSLDQIRVLPGKEEMAPLTRSMGEHVLENTA